MGRKKGKGNPKGTNGTPKKRQRVGKVRAFLAAYAVKGNVREACEIADCSVTQVYERLKPESPRYNPQFAEKFEQAKEEAIQRLEQEARRRAELGCPRLKFTKGGELICIPDPNGRTRKVKKFIKVGKKVVQQEVEEPVMVPYIEYEYSDTLAIFLLKSLRPEVYRENYTVSGRMDGVHLHLQGGQMPTPDKLMAETMELITQLQSQQQVNGKKGIESNGHSNGKGDK